jgi:hypothetical protein
VRRVRNLFTARRAAYVCLLLLALVAGGYGISKLDVDGWASADADSSAPPAGAPHPPANPAVSSACATTVLGALGDIAKRVYHEGVLSERTAAAAVFVERSLPLREAIERDDPRAARAAAQALIATGHMTSLQITRTMGATEGANHTGESTGNTSRVGSHASEVGNHAGEGMSHAGEAGGQAFVNAGTPSALAPLHGTITGADGSPIATFVASVWADEGFISEMNGITQGQTTLRENGHDIAASFPLPAGRPGEPRAAQGALTINGVPYLYTSLSATAYPEGQPLRVYVLRSPSSIAPLCASTSTGTLVNMLTRIAQLIYTSEGGPHALVQVHRAQHNQALLHAVAAHEPQATRLAIDKLLNQHIVRMRVSSQGRLLSDVGGPYVLAPVRAPLRLHGRQIGTMVLSIQDDEGYKRLAERLAGLDVLMYMAGPGGGSRLVKNSLGPLTGTVPSSGAYRYRGHDYRVFTLHAQAFPSGPLRIVALIPIPYS